jgi:predicted N-formylglutamate amidohydrolase
MGAERRADIADFVPVSVSNRAGAGPFVIVCDHASNYVPAKFGTLGLRREDLVRHIAWDPGALGVAAKLAQLLDAPLVESRVSRLIIDCNRPLDAPDLIPSLSETTEIPGNMALDAAAWEERIALSHRPFHAAVDGLVEERSAAGLGCQMIAVHSFTPVYRSVSRPWQIGIIHDEDQRLSAPLIAALQRLPGITVGVNQPYSPADRVYYTLERHARSRDLPCVMIEIRNDEIAGTEAEARWAEMLAAILREIAFPVARKAANG